MRLLVLVLCCMAVMGPVTELKSPPWVIAFHGACPVLGPTSLTHLRGTCTRVMKIVGSFKVFKYSANNPIIVDGDSLAQPPRISRRSRAKSTTDESMELSDLGSAIPIKDSKLSNAMQHVLVALQRSEQAVINRSRWHHGDCCCAEFCNSLNQIVNGLNAGLVCSPARAAHHTQAAFTNIMVNKSELYSQCMKDFRPVIQQFEAEILLADIPEFACIDVTLPHGHVSVLKIDIEVLIRCKLVDPLGKVLRNPRWIWIEVFFVDQDGIELGFAPRARVVPDQHAPRENVISFHGQLHAAKAGFASADTEFGVPCRASELHVVLRVDWPVLRTMNLKVEQRSINIAAFCSDFRMS